MQHFLELMTYHLHMMQVSTELLTNRLVVTKSLAQTLVKVGTYERLVQPYLRDCKVCGGLEAFANFLKFA